jgi:uncharacterized protein YjiS (DUF1127 family)
MPTHIISSPDPIAAEALVGKAGALMKLKRALQRIVRSRASSRELEGMNDRALEDVGMPRAQRLRDCLRGPSGRPLA